jgi:hypothetical protein
VNEERRKDRRMKLSVPIRVQGHTPEGPAWEEMTSCEDASYGGASFALRHPADQGQVLLLHLPLPKNFRSYALSDASYTTYGLVRSVQGRSPARVSVMFLGKTPPRGYEANPGGRYLLSTDPKPAPRERRKLKRLAAFVNLRLRRIDPAGRTIHEEQTVTENVSRGGARVMTSLPAAKGERVVVEDLGRSFQADAEITNVFIGKDGVSRLNLHFVSGGVPDQLVAAAGLGPTDL